MNFQARALCNCSGGGTCGTCIVEVSHSFFQNTYLENAIAPLGNNGIHSNLSPGIDTITRHLVFAQNSANILFFFVLSGC